MQLHIVEDKRRSYTHDVNSSMLAICEQEALFMTVLATASTIQVPASPFCRNLAGLRGLVIGSSSVLGRFESAG